MHGIRRLSLPATALVCACASAQIVEPRTANERALVEGVSKGLSSCFTTLGPKRTFPTVSAAPPQSELLASVLLQASGAHVSDGYNYMLLLHGPSNAAFVVQLGGFASLRKVYGPIPLNTSCPEHAAQSPSQASARGQAWHLTPPSSGRPPAGCACLRPPLMSNVRPHAGTPERARNRHDSTRGPCAQLCWRGSVRG